MEPDTDPDDFDAREFARKSIEEYQDLFNRLARE